MDQLKAKRQAAAVDSKAEPAEAPPRKVLTKDDIAELAAQYSPNKMSQEGIRLKRSKTKKFRATKSRGRVSKGDLLRDFLLL